jgi:predicted negative regulator of RcsB-dependent stress response
MTSPFSTSERSESLMDWFQLHSRAVIWGGAAVVLLAGGGWFYKRSSELKAQRAERAYYSAARPITTGNFALAESDLKKMIERYDGTTASIQARLQLAQVMYEQGKYQQGVDYLKASVDDISSSDEFGASVHLVLAAGYEQLKKYAEAAAEYEDAAKAARFDADRQRFLAQAAMAYLSAGNKAKASAIWTDLGKDSKGVVAGEARVRLGEISAAVAPQS